MLFQGTPHRAARSICSGDFNGDHFDDLALSGPLENKKCGRVAVFNGAPGGLAKEPAWSTEGDRETRMFGESVTAADVNGDGFTDLIVTRASMGDAACEAEMEVCVFSGSPDGLAQTPAQTIARPGGLRLRPLAVAAGDLNSDGFADVAVTGVDPASKVDGGSSVLVLSGSAAGLQTTPSWVFRSEQAGCDFATHIAAVGDVNGDGFGDLMVSAKEYSGRYKHGGKAYLFLGSRNGLGRAPVWVSEYPRIPQKGYEGHLFFGGGLSGAGDVNKDGYGDVLIGAWNATQGDVGEGTAFLYLGSPDGLHAKPCWAVEGNNPHVLLGYGVGAAGDVNGDGFDDALLSSLYASHGQNNEGVILLYLGSPKGLAAHPAWTYDGDRSSGHLGEFVGRAGDVNGDGQPDLLFAGPDCAESEEPRLRAVLIYGREGGPVGSSQWNPHKPLLAVVQQTLERLPTGVGVSLSLGSLLLLASGSFLALVKVRRSLALVIADNRRLAAMQERTRIARDIHDHLGADLTRMAAELDRIDGALPAPVSRLRSSAHHAVRTLDELVWATDPQKDSLEGLAEYLAEFAPAFCEVHGLQCELDLPPQLPPLSVPARTRHNLFLIAKEALRNVARHAAAKKVRVSLRQSDHTLTLAVEDDGRGMDFNGNGSGSEQPGLTSSITRRGNGVANMHARANELGSEVVIASTPGGGTRVEVIVPLNGMTPITRSNGYEHRVE